MRSALFVPVLLGLVSSYAPSAHDKVGMVLLLQGRYGEAGGYFVKALSANSIAAGSTNKTRLTM